MTNFPTALDALTNPSGTDALDAVAVPHATQHANANDAIEALQAKVGVDGSEVTGSLDYKVAALETSKAPKTGTGATGTWSIDISGVAATASAAAGETQFSHRNKVINGDFRINQRGYVSGAAVGAGLYAFDRWKMAASGDSVTFATVNNKTIVTIPAGKVWRQVIDGLNFQTGTHVMSWEGTAQGKIGDGSLSASGVTGAITGGTDTTIEFGPGTVANVQLEPGSVATPFEHRHFGAELLLAQRYYYRLHPGATNKVLGLGFTSSTSSAVVETLFPSEMRSAPVALEQSGSASAYMIAHTSLATVLSAVPTFSAATVKSAVTSCAVASGLTSGQCVQIRTDSTNGATAYLGWSAEL